MIDIILAIFILIGGIVLVIFSSKYAVKHSAMLATALGISPLIIGVTLVSIGTDISEIFNSIISCSLGHGDIDVGDSVGSDLTQLTLIFGILPIACGAFRIHRRDIIILGSCEVLSLIVIFSIVEKGYITRLNAIFMVFSLFIYIWLIYNSNKESIKHRIEILEVGQPTKKKSFHFLIAVIGFVGVTISSYMIVQSVIYISQAINIHEYILSFFVLAIGTSLPELVVDINALRCGHHSIAIGDIVGSCIVDSTLSIGIGQVFFPQAVTAELAVPTVLYTLIVSIIVIVTIAVRKKMDKKAGVFFIFLYLIAYLLLFTIII
ncbi:MAG: sodium:calcium antiporter [Candidatus Lokiarchaeota archaeon]|nr:sodium:calcium antiporter [Candidatus Lokiarchaeota archaeon]